REPVLPGLTRANKHSVSASDSRAVSSQAVAARGSSAGLNLVPTLQHKVTQVSEVFVIDYERTAGEVNAVSAKCPNRFRAAAKLDGGLGSVNGAYEFRSAGERDRHTGIQTVDEEVSRSARLIHNSISRNAHRPGNIKFQAGSTGNDKATD